MGTTIARLQGFEVATAAATRAEEQQFFGGFTFHGKTSFASVAQFYGLDVPAAEPGATLADYLVQACSGNLREGYCVAIATGRAELIIREIEDGTVKKAGLRILPAVSCQRRKHRLKSRMYDARITVSRKAAG